MAASFPPQEGEDTCILLWAKGLSVSILRSGRWEEHDLTPSTFGEGVSPQLHGSSCDKSKSKWVVTEAPPPSDFSDLFQQLHSGSFTTSHLCFYFRLVLNYENVLGHRSFKLM